jgi:hypothetical protein
MAIQQKGSDQYFTLIWCEKDVNSILYSPFTLSNPPRKFPESSEGHKHGLISDVCQETLVSPFIREMVKN